MAARLVSYEAAKSIIEPQMPSRETIPCSDVTAATVPSLRVANRIKYLHESNRRPELGRECIREAVEAARERPPVVRANRRP